jgi:hypothetical protein
MVYSTDRSFVQICWFVSYARQAHSCFVVTLDSGVYPETVQGRRIYARRELQSALE